MGDIKGREVFSVGKWNGDVYVEKDLDDMVTAFEETKDKFKPYIKLGHNKEQLLLKKDGMPSAGWVTNLYKEGGKLLADISDIPDKIYQLIKNKAMPYVSSEIYWGIDVDGKNYNKMLAGVALLGSDMPAVTNLDDFLSLYGIENNLVRQYTDKVEVKTYSFEEENSNKDDIMPTIEELEAEKAALEAEKAALVADKEAIEAEKKETEDAKAALETEVAEFKAKAQELEQKNKEQEVDGFISEYKIAPSMQEHVRSLLGEEKKEYSIQKKVYSKKEVLGELIKLYSEASVNLDENSEAGDKIKETDLDKVKKYSAEHKCSTREAMAALNINSEIK